MESADLSTWSADFGGGEYNSGTGDTTASRDQAHTGDYSAKLTITTPSSPTAGTRMFRWAESRKYREAYYSAWFYFNENFTMTADPCCGRFFNLFQFKSRGTSGENDPLWFIDLQPDGTGGLKPTLEWWHRTLEGPHPGESGLRRYQPLVPIKVPTGSWFQVKCFLRQSKDFDGRVTCWWNSQLVFDVQGVRTSFANCNYNAWCTSNEWSVNNYSDGLTPNPATIYLDDAVISTS